MKRSPQDHSELPELPTLADLLTGPCRITREQEVMENRVRNILQTTQGLPHYLPVLWPWGDPFMCQWPHLEKGTTVSCPTVPHRAAVRTGYAQAQQATLSPGGQQLRDLSTAFHCAQTGLVSQAGAKSSADWPVMLEFLEV